MNTKYIMLLLATLWIGACKNSPKQTKETVLHVSNDSQPISGEAPIYVPSENVLNKFPSAKAESLAFSINGNRLDHQLISKEGKSHFLLIPTFAPGKSFDIKVEALSDSDDSHTPKKRTYAEIAHKVDGEWKDRKYIGGKFKNVTQLDVPPEHTDHSHYVRYEGPGWESDLVGYRFYLDWRNAVDIFGKHKKEMVLHEVGQDGFDSYHEPAAWGMDILKVGKSLGLGSMGFWENGAATRVEKTSALSCKVGDNGPLQSSIVTTYSDWEIAGHKTDLTSTLSICAGSRVTTNTIRISQNLPNMCTGIVKHEAAELLTGKQGNYAYLATWGKQSLAEDNLGMAVLYKTSDLIETTEDEHSHVVVLRPQANALTYHFLAAWEKDPEGIKTKSEFIQYLEDQLLLLNNPPSFTM